MTNTALAAPVRARTVGRFLLCRWPAAAAIALELISWGIGVERAGQILPLLPSLYVIVAVIRRRGASWPVLLAAIALLFLLQLQSWVNPTVAILALATAVAADRAVPRSRPHPSCSSSPGAWSSSVASP